MENPTEKPVGFSPKTEAGLAKKTLFSVAKNFSAEKLRLALTDKIFFLDAFGSLVNAGIPIVRALQIIYFQSRNEKLRSLALFLKREIEGGANMAKTAANLPNVFSTFDVAMFEMGEATGKIGRVLEIVTEREEKSLELSRKVRQALVYPIAIAVIAVAMITVIMTYVVPKIEGIYREAHANLPALTTAVIWTSRFLRGYGILLLVFGFLAAMTIPVALKKPAIRMQFDEMVLRIPVFGTILRKKILVSYCEFLASLLSSGIVINRAL
ncbi:MAG: type II secretion system F family protein [Patescibacteria group bacterium]